MVVALLVMLALIGTAFLSSSRADRAAAQTGTSNSQVDLLAQGVSDMATNSIVNALYDQSASPSVYRNPMPVVPNPVVTAGTASYHNFTAPDVDWYLASRIPTGSAAAPQWDWISASPTGLFEDPRNLVTWGSAMTTPPGRKAVTVGSVSVSGINYPALTAGGTQYLAGDADGDGIADCGLFPIGTIPGAQFSGLKFYAGIRIVDNNSAVNASTAWTFYNDASTTANKMPGFVAGDVRNNRLTPMSIGLREMMSDAAPPATPSLVPTKEFDFLANLATGGEYPLVNFRCNAGPGNTFGTTPAPWNIATTVYGDFVPTAPSTLTPNLRTDYSFISQLDCFWSQLGSRANFPGFGFFSGTTGYRLQSLSDADSISLAYRFILVNSAANPSWSTSTSAYLSAPSQIERSLHSYLYNNTYSATIFKSTAYAASDYTNWFNNNFNYPNSASGFTTSQPTPTAFYGTGMSPANLRPLLVAHNPVSNLAPAHLPMPYTAAAVTQTFNDFPAIPALAHTYVTGSTYQMNDIVAWPDSTKGTLVRCYRSQAINNTATPSNTTNWRQLRSYVGLFDASGSTKYFNGDVVSYRFSTTNNYASFVCINTSGAGITTAPTLIPDPPPAGKTADPNWAYIGWSALPAKVNVNKASFEDLTQAYWNVMVSDPSSATSMSPFGGAAADNSGTHTYDGENFGQSNGASPPVYTEQQNGAVVSDFASDGNISHSQRMFRSVIRDPQPAASRTYLTPTQMVTLRSAITAVNTLELRDHSDSTNLATYGTGDVTAREVQIPADGANPAYNAVVYGVEKQPFITEIYVNSDAKTDYKGTGKTSNPNGYIAIELYNPTGNAIVLTNWYFGVVDRSSTATMPLSFSSVIHIPTITIPALGWYVIDNIGGGATDASFVSGSATAKNDFTSSSNYSHISGLDAVLNHEMVLLRPRHADGTAASGTYSTGTAFSDLATGASTTSALDLVPIDSFDFTNIQSNPIGPNFDIWHYVRNTNTPWSCVYPGRYNGNATWYRQQGTQNAAFTPGKTNPAQPDNDAISAASGLTPPIQLGAADSQSSYPDTFTIQLNNIDFGGPNQISTSTNRFPLGGFMRDGDILRVTFIGSYRLKQTGDAINQFHEINGVTMDAAFSEDTDTTDNGEENIGRFCPLMLPLAALPAGTTDLVQHPMEYNYTAPLAANLRYAWAGRLFDYLTVRDPMSQSLPDADAAVYSAFSNQVTPQPVPTSASAVSENSSLTGAPIIPGSHPEAGIDGLINVNTAPYPVLAAVPWTVGDGVATDLSDNAAIAQAIVSWRSTNGPFRSLFEINRVIDSASGNSLRMREGNWGTESKNMSSLGFNGASTFKNNIHGDFSPAATIAGTTPAQWDQNGNVAATDGVNNDFESQYLMMTRLSNLLTTRSDTFTVYIVVEGWENAGVVVGGVPQAKRVIQQRRAFLVDRTNVTPFNRVPRITPIPTN